MFEPEQFESVFSLLEICEVWAQRAFSCALLSSRYPVGLAVANHLNLIEELDFHLKMLLDGYPFTLSPHQLILNLICFKQEMLIYYHINQPVSDQITSFKLVVAHSESRGINLVLSVLFIALPSCKLQLYNIQYRKCWSYSRHTYC